MVLIGILFHPVHQNRLGWGRPSATRRPISQVITYRQNIIVTQPTYLHENKTIMKEIKGLVTPNPLKSTAPYICSSELSVAYHVGFCHKIKSFRFKNKPKFTDATKSRVWEDFMTKSLAQDLF